MLKVRHTFCYLTLLRADPEAGELAELAHIKKRFAWFSIRNDVDMCRKKIRES